MKRHRGFTLIEMMIVVVILAILAGIAYPSYTRYVIETRRADGQIALTQTAARLEKFYTQCNRYTVNLGGRLDACSGLGISGTSPDGFYTLTIAALPEADGGTGDIATSYLITATPVPPQTADTDCGSLTLNSRGQRGQAGPNVQGKCWRR